MKCLHDYTYYLWRRGIPWPEDSAETFKSYLVNWRITVFVSHLLNPRHKFRRVNCISERVLGPRKSHDALGSNVIICHKLWQIIVNYFQRRKQPPTELPACRLPLSLLRPAAARGQARWPGRAVELPLVVLVPLLFLERPLFTKSDTNELLLSFLLIPPHLDPWSCGWPRNGLP